MFRLITIASVIFELILNIPRIPSASIVTKHAKYIIIFICDGCGSNHFDAANKFSDTKPSYQYWSNYWVSTFSFGGSYDPNQAWSSFDYVKLSATDSAAAATAIFTGLKTSNGRINVSADYSSRFINIAEEAHQLGLTVGAVTSVPISHATPAAWFSHNDSRTNGYALADELLWGSPNTTGTYLEPLYGGGHGNTLPPIDVIIGGGHPLWPNNYVNLAIKNKLISENDPDGSFRYVERITGSNDGGIRLFTEAIDPAVTRLVGLFGGPEGNFEYQLADGVGTNFENPTLAVATRSAIKVLERDGDGFVLMVEGGAIDTAAHSNNMDKMIGEINDFNLAIEEAINWIEDPSKEATWNNSLVIVTADHETGYLSTGPQIFPTQSFGEISESTLVLEKTYDSTNHLKASWQDTDQDNLIDTNEEVYWAWNSTSHTNSLVQLFAKGVGETNFFRLADSWDPVRGAYIDNTDIYQIMHQALNGLEPVILYKTNLPIIL